MFKCKVLITTMLLSAVSFGADKKPTPGCPQIDMTKLDKDGMPFCPDEVKGENSAWAVYSCAISQAKSFHPPTAPELKSMRTLLVTYKQVVDAGAVAAATTKQLLQSADELNLQACRVVKQKADALDSFLLFYTKPKVTDYSGPFMMLREVKPSKVILIGPHDDSDGTFADTKIGVANSSAMGLFSNGHRRGDVGQVGRATDFVHSTNNLGTKAVAMMGDMFQGYVWLHVHGMKDPNTALYRARNPQIEKSFIDAIKTYTNVRDFNPKFNAYFTVDALVNTNFYLKTELPARLHSANKNVIANIVKTFEQNDWAWPSKQ